VDLIVTIAANRVATVATPHEDWFGSETIIFTAEDPDGLADSDSAIFTVTNVNDAPVAVDDLAETSEDTQVIISVLSNDIDVDNDPLTVQSVTSPLHGTAVIYQDTAVTYTPNTDFFGADSFSYTMIDGNGGSSQAVVTLTVTAENDAPVVSGIPDQSIQEGSSFTTISLDNYVEDVDNADSEMAWTYSGNTELTVTINGNRIAAIGLPSSDWNGEKFANVPVGGMLIQSTDELYYRNGIGNAVVRNEDGDGFLFGNLGTGLTLDPPITKTATNLLVATYTLSFDFGFPVTP